MGTVFKYNDNAKYLTEDLKGGHNSINFALLDIYLDEKKKTFRKNPAVEYL